MLHMWGVVGRGIGADILQLIFAEVTPQMLSGC